jgi:hypothetical protein
MMGIKVATREATMAAATFIFEAVGKDHDLTRRYLYLSGYRTVEFIL